MSHLTTSEDLPSATFSPGLESGLTRSASPDGLMTSQSGLVPARASLSARQAKEMGLLTSGTYGQPSSISSASADLSMSLANRLQQVTQTHGSTLYKLTWKEWDTPSGLCRLRQRASVRRTSESELTGWPTPVVGDMTGGPRPPDKKRGPAPGLQSATALTGWPTPQVSNITNATTVQMSGDGRATPNKIGWAAALAGWVTPTTRDWKDTPGMTALRDGKERLDQLPRQAFMMGWPTPTTSNTRSPSVDAAMNMYRQDGSKTQQRLQDFAGITGPLRLTVFGEMLTGSYVEMANGVQLNPAHSRWLMGLPRAWDESSPGWQEWQEWQAATESADSKATVMP